MNKNRKSEIIECSCGHGMFKVEQFIDDGFTYLSYYVDPFFDQDGVIKKFGKWLMLLFSIFWGRKYQLFDITIDNNDDLNRFKYFVASMREIENESSKSNES